MDWLPDGFTASENSLGAMAEEKQPDPPPIYELHPPEWVPRAHASADLGKHWYNLGHNVLIMSSQRICWLLRSSP